MKKIALLLSVALFTNTVFAQYKVSGKLLKDNCGETIVLKGVNTMSPYVTNPEGQFAEIAKTGANSVRIQIEPWTSIATVKQWIDACITAEMIPILAPQYWTGSSNGNPTWYTYGQTHTDVFNAIVGFWTSVNLKNLLLQYQNKIIINLANEPDGSWAIGSDGDYAGATTQAAVDRLSFFNANKTAITALRNAGYTCPLMIDGPDNAHDMKFHTLYADQLQQHDPIHNLVFSVHAYWPTSSNCTNSVSDAKVTQRMTDMGALNQPIVMGEIAAKNVCNNGNTENINYNLLLQKLAQYNLGYHVWWWGGNQEANNALSMTNNGTYAGLTGDGLIMAVSHANSIKNTSVKPYSLTHNGVCEILHVNNTEMSVLSIYNTERGIVVTSQHTLKKVEIYDVTARKVYSNNKINDTQLTIDKTSLGKQILIVKAETYTGKILSKKVMIK